MCVHGVPTTPEHASKSARCHVSSCHCAEHRGDASRSRSNPVVPGGHSFCAACIEALPADIRDGAFESACPLCRTPFTLGSSVPNWSLREMLPAPALADIAREDAAERPVEPQLAAEPIDIGEAPADDEEAAAESEEEISPPPDVGAALAACRRLVAEPSFVALTQSFHKEHCEAFGEGEESRLEHTTLHERYVALCERELVAGLAQEMGPGFDMGPLLDALPAYLREHGDALRHLTAAADDDAAELASLADTLAVLHRLTSFVDFKADMQEERRRRHKSDAAMRANMDKYFAVVKR